MACVLKYIYIQRSPLLNTRTSVSEISSGTGRTIWFEFQGFYKEESNR
jgi:hypothetical protein